MALLNDFGGSRGGIVLWVEFLFASDQNPDHGTVDVSVRRVQSTGLCSHR